MKQYPTQFKKGLIIGKFAPLNLGHINLINYASTLCEEVLVILSYDEKWLKTLSVRDQRILTLKNRLRWLKQVYQDISHVKIIFIDETAISSYPEGRKAFSALIRNELERLHYSPDVLFSSELAHDKFYNEYFPEIKHILVDVDHTNVPISANEIRQNLLEYWRYLPSVVRQDYVKRVCIIGVESTGKTTLTKYLAKQFNTAWVEEYGRSYCESVLCGDEFLLTSEDYVKIAVHRKYLEETAAKNANNGVLFCDTNSFITQFYHCLHQGCEHPVLQAFALTEKYDLILILEPNVPWVSDGLRKCGEKTQRQKTITLFQEMLAKYQYDKKPVIRITAFTYRERLENAISLVRDLLKSRD